MSKVTFFAMSLPSLFCRYFSGVRRILHVLEKNINTTRKMDTWCAEKQRILNMDLEAKRKLLYNMKKYVVLDDIPTWREDCANEHFAATKPPTELDIEQFQEFSMDISLNRFIANKVSIWKGDITELEIDAIVNAANSTLAGGGGVDGFIHRAAGRELKKECLTLNGCKTGDAKITGGYCLPAKYVIHTVGPQDKSHLMLASCYQSCFHLQRENKLKSIAFPCISTGVYGFPNRPAAHIALSTARKNIEDDIKKYDGSLERVIFCVFLKEDMEIYQSVAQLYFPAE